MKSVRTWAASFALFSCFACEEKQYGETKEYNNPVDLRARPEGERQPSSRAATPLSAKEREQTSRALAAARCDREQRCNNVGDGKKYASRDACLGVAVADWKQELDMYNCPGGTKEGALDRCADEIRNDGCLNPLASLERIVDCDTNSLCRNPDPRP